MPNISTCSDRSCSPHCSHDALIQPLQCPRTEHKQALCRVIHRQLIQQPSSQRSRLWMIQQQHCLRHQATLYHLLSQYGIKRQVVQETQHSSLQVVPTAGLCESKQLRNDSRKAGQTVLVLLHAADTQSTSMTYELRSAHNHPADTKTAFRQGATSCTSCTKLWSRNRNRYYW